MLLCDHQSTGEFLTKRWLDVTRQPVHLTTKQWGSVFCRQEFVVCPQRLHVFLSPPWCHVNQLRPLFTLWAPRLLRATPGPGVGAAALPAVRISTMMACVNSFFFFTQYIFKKLKMPSVCKWGLKNDMAISFHIGAASCQLLQCWVLQFTVASWIISRSESKFFCFITILCVPTAANTIHFETLELIKML